MSYPDLNGEHAAISDIQDLLRKSITLDPWIPDTHRVLSWSYIAQEKWNDAIHGFRQALDVSPMDPFNAISVAKGLAYAGDTGTGLRIAEKAFNGSDNIPALLYEYFGNIHFAAGNYDRAAHFLKRSPKDSFNGLVGLLAAQTAGGMHDQIPETEKLLKHATVSNFGHSLRGRSTQVLEWFKSRHGFANPDANQAFKNILPAATKIITET
jgi:tetratricopeptide (TPR) repeat protein